MPTVEFLPLAVNPDDYPASHLSMLPSTARMKWLRDRQTAVPSAFLGRSDFFIYGRYALVEALKRAGAGPGRAVLMPAYHCRTVVEAVLYLGAEARFYMMTEDLKPDVASMNLLMADGRVCAMLMTHYFGFANALKGAMAFCTQQNIALIEDCAHAFYGEHEGQVLGTVGHFAIASAWKFLPVRDGAMLRDNTNSRASSKLVRQPLLNEVKSLAALLGLKRSKKQGRPDRPDIDASMLVARAREIQAAGPGQQKDEADEFQFWQVDKAGLRTSRWALRHAPHDQVAASRRDNYQLWLDGVKGLPAVEPLFPVLPDGVVPYAFPLLTDAEGLIFHALKLAGIPIWRWENVARTHCPIARGYRLRLLQLPCHQDLRAEDVAWMLDTLKAVLSVLHESESPRRKMSLQ